MTITQRNLDGYGAPPIGWARVDEVLDSQLTQAPGSGGPQRHTLWLTTINPDGGPHVTPVAMVRCGGSWYFTSGPATRKSRNLARDGRCVVSVATDPFDLVVEGAAKRVTDANELAFAAEAFAAWDWPVEVAGDALTGPYSAPSAGPAPWHVYRVDPSTVFALGTSEPFGATKFQLP
ncbi:pyridoxamine 5'-phosphate oxidase [Mycobacterium alsense]|uniref:Pyridoxamine 5'-phosphate oxidase n=1 Tax=Mycobacterium alsense TaxID=324058 RepID=A0ABD6P987_9MYCO|nr:pyridoxamine 5'-phosphate oxidase family protein [Mycobacterium alsense]OBG47221.1 pyridoxamine 5'-phosphate oxidase [Mycobacterium alsense]